MAGVIVGIVALPLAIAFAIASGVSPDRGLISRHRRGLSDLGAGRVACADRGPTGAFVVIVYGDRPAPRPRAITIATLRRVACSSSWRCAPGTDHQVHPAPGRDPGFTSVLSVVIFSSQVKDFSGCEWATYRPASSKMGRPSAEHNEVNPWAVAIASMALLVIAVWPRVSRRLPGAFVAIVLTAVLVNAFDCRSRQSAHASANCARTLPRPLIPNSRSMIHVCSSSTLL